MKNNKIIGGIVSLVGFGLLTYFYGWGLAGIICLIIIGNNIERLKQQ